MVMSPLIGDRWPLACTQTMRSDSIGAHIVSLVLFHPGLITQALAAADAKGG